MAGIFNPGNPLPTATPSPIDPGRIPEAEMQRRGGLVVRFRADVGRVLTSKIRLPLYLRQCGLNITLQQAAAWYNTVVKYAIRIRGRDTATIARVVAFLEFGVGTGIAIPSDYPTAPPPATPAEWIRFCVRQIDAVFWEDDYTPKLPLTAIWTARDAADDDDADRDRRDRAIRDLDPFVAPATRAHRDDVDLANYLTAIYRAQQRASPNSGMKMLMDAIIYSTLAISKGGNITLSKADKINTAVQVENGINLNIEPESFQQTFNLIHAQVLEHGLNYADILSAMSALFNFDDYMRINLTITQALGVGTSAVNLVLQAISSYPNHEVWAYLNREAPVEVAAFTLAARRVAHNQLIGLGTHTSTEEVKGTQFTSLGYAAYNLLLLKGQVQTVKQYANKFACPKASTILAIIKKVEETFSEDLDIEAFRGDNAFDWSTELSDLTLICSSLNIN